jgi:predicted benzoate:H+ symporter BenE
MKRKRNFIISGILVFLAGFLSHLAWITYRQPISIAAMVSAAVLFMAGVIVFAVNFRE